MLTYVLTDQFSSCILQSHFRLPPVYFLLQYIIYLSSHTLWVSVYYNIVLYLISTYTGYSIYAFFNFWKFTIIDLPTWKKLLPKKLQHVVSCKYPSQMIFLKSIINVGKKEIHQIFIKIELLHSCIPITQTPPCTFDKCRGILTNNGNIVHVYVSSVIKLRLSQTLAANWRQAGWAGGHGSRQP